MQAVIERNDGSQRALKGKCRKENLTERERRSGLDCNRKQKPTRGFARYRAARKAQIPM